MTNEINKKYDIYKRVFDFAVRVFKFIEKLPNSLIVRECGRQLVRSAGSIGANLEEADGALTKKDFINKVGISRRESSESRHWLKLLKSTIEMSSRSEKELDWLISESTEIILILSSIIKKSQDNQ